MKYLAIFGLLALTLACGGATDESAPEPAAPAALVAGPGTITAPDGVSIVYTVSGEGSPALVFIHGWMCDQTFWAAQVEEFSQTNTVIMIDLPGRTAMIGRYWPSVATCKKWSSTSTSTRSFSSDTRWAGRRPSRPRG